MEKIEVKNVTKRFGKVKALDNLSFRVSERETFALLGPSGCGKTTVMRIIAGLETLDEGEILVDGQIVASQTKTKKISVAPDKRHIGLVFQGYALWPHMTVQKNISYGLETRKLSKEEIATKVRSSLELVGLSGLGERYPSQLSGGQQQRVALARALVYGPEVLLLDEPLSNLDKKERDRMRGELQRLLKEIGVTAIYVTHDQEEAFTISDRVALMKDGQLIQQGTPRTLYEEPANSFVAEFIGRANMLEIEVKSVDERKRVATLNVPEMGVELVCKYSSEIFPKDLSLVLVRHNEIGLFSDKPDFRENVVKGTAIAREYRGGNTDHKVRVGNCTLVVTTHKFCQLANTCDTKDVYLYIPPEAVTFVPKSHRLEG